MNIFIEIPLTLIKSDLIFNRNVVTIFQKFLTTKNSFKIDFNHPRDCKMGHP